MHITGEFHGIVPVCESIVSKIHILSLFNLIPGWEKQLNSLLFSSNTLETLLSIEFDFDSGEKVLMPVDYVHWHTVVIAASHWKFNYCCLISDFRVRNSEIVYLREDSRIKSPSFSSVFNIDDIFVRRGKVNFFGDQYLIVPTCCSDAIFWLYRSINIIEIKVTQQLWLVCVGVLISTRGVKLCMFNIDVVFIIICESLRKSNLEL